MHFTQILHDLRVLIKKIEQVQRIYGNCWEERVNLYASIIVSSKKGKGIFRKKITNFPQSFAAELQRLDTIHKREQRVMASLQAHTEETTALASNIIEQLHDANLEQTLTPQLAALNILNTYFQTSIHSQREFLRLEAMFLHLPSATNLRPVYCALQNMQTQAEQLDKLYDSANIKTRATQEILKNIQKFNADIDQCISKAKIEGNPEKTTKLMQLKRALQPYFDATNREVFGNMQQRISFFTTHLPRNIPASALRGIIVAPLIINSIETIFGADASSSMRIGNEIIFFDFYLLILGYSTMVFEAVTGIMKHATDAPKLIAQKLLKETGSANPLGFHCT